MCARPTGQTISAGRAFLEQSQAPGLFLIYLSWFLPILPCWLHPQPIKFNGGCGNRPAGASPLQGARGTWGRQTQGHTSFGGTGEEQNSLASRTHWEQRESGGSWRGRRPGPGGALEGLSLSALPLKSLCVQFGSFLLGTVGGWMGRGVFYLEICTTSNHKWHSLRQQSQDLVRQHHGLLNGLG